MVHIYENVQIYKTSKYTVTYAFHAHSIFYYMHAHTYIEYLQFTMEKELILSQMFSDSDENRRSVLRGSTSIGLGNLDLDDLDL
jgi:hypothetical protein